jgi:ribosomal-protein-serine acetyltransferase
MESTVIEISKLPLEIKVDDEITLRASNESDLDEFIKCILENIEFLKEYMLWARSENVEQESKESLTDSIEARKNNESTNYYIIYKGVICGGTGIHKREETGMYLEFGYWLAEKQNGKGIITRSIEKLTELVFDNTEALGVDIGCDSNNIKSQAIPKRLGFKDVFNGSRMIDGLVPHECVGPLYRLTRKEWESRQ